jgi:hypothetical protein
VSIHCKSAKAFRGNTAILNCLRPESAREVKSTTELNQSQIGNCFPMRTNILQSQIMNMGHKVRNTRRVISRSQFNKLIQKEFFNLSKRK